ncbi:MAG: Nif3-like dinuclear metal center hexameric protein [Chromatiales bacterium]|jgi:dinuclear metal center YbgI/SA1388 family protein
MIQAIELEAWCNARLAPENFSDYCPNGLQVEGRRPARRIATGVTASRALVEAAVAWEADAILVHHGYFWRGEPEPLRGMKGERVRTLMQNDVSLLAYHLPLDAHPEYGNNATLGRLLGLRDAEATDAGTGLLWRGRLEKPMAPQDFARHIGEVLRRPPLLVACERPAIESIGWCTGGAQKFIDDAADLGLDAYISGEISESTYHTAIERNIHYFAAGHHATERYGIQALGEAAATALGLEHRYFELDNPV